MLPQDGEGVGTGVAGVDLDGEAEPFRHLELDLEQVALGRFVGVIIVLVEPDLPHRHAFFVRGEFFEGLEEAGADRLPYPSP